MAPHCTGWVAELSSTELQTQMLWPVSVHDGGGAGAGHDCTPGVGLLASHCLIWPVSSLAALSTATTALSTVLALGRAFEGSPHVPHVDRAAVIAPCCAACWTVE